MTIEAMSTRELQLIREALNEKIDRVDDAATAWPRPNPRPLSMLAAERANLERRELAQKLNEELARRWEQG